MTAVEHYHAMAVSQPRQAKDGVHSSSVCATFWIDGRRKVHRHYDTHIVAGIVAERLGLRTAMCFVDVEKRVIQIRDLMHTRVDLLVPILVTLQGVNIIGLSNVIRHNKVALSRLFL